jgi:hypothetical protein
MLLSGTGSTPKLSAQTKSSYDESRGRLSPVLPPRFQLSTRLIMTYHSPGGLRSEKILRHPECPNKDHRIMFDDVG